MAKKSKPARSNAGSYHVVSSDPRVHRDLEALPSDGRLSSLPPMYRYVGGVHPQLRGSGNESGVTYIYLIDSSSAGRRAYHALASTIRIPGTLTPNL